MRNRALFFIAALAASQAALSIEPQPDDFCTNYTAALPAIPANAQPQWRAMQAELSIAIEASKKATAAFKTAEKNRDDFYKIPQAQRGTWDPGPFQLAQNMQTLCIRECKYALDNFGKVMHGTAPITFTPQCAHR